MEMDIPATVKALSIIKGKQKRFYTTHINNKQSIFAFTNSASALECSKFLNRYRQKYTGFPTINMDRYIPSPNIQEISESLVTLQMKITNENTDKLIEKCAMSNLGLILISSFDFIEHTDNIDCNFTGESVIIDYEPIYTIETLNELLYIE
jgi:hypothetical protein